MARVLRRFLYLESRVVDEFVSQIEDGLYGEEAQRIVSGAGRSVGGGVGVGAGPVSAKARGGRESSSQDERARTVQQTPESRFARLYDSLDNEQAIQPWITKSGTNSDEARSLRRTGLSPFQASTNWWRSRISSHPSSACSRRWAKPRLTTRQPKRCEGLARSLASSERTCR
jgi:O-methyltransferase involved in polyketide biosynthesis